jgi:bifunctional non-homologous end joining protein LigD
VKPDGRTSFLQLASALQSGTDPEERVVYYVFDLLHLDGYDLTRAPLRERKEALRRLIAPLGETGRVRYVDHVEGHGDEFFRQACGLALEGSIAKRRDAPYRPGRGRDWLKVKCLRRQEFVVGGFTERADAAGGVGALLLGFHEKPAGPLRYAGRVGTGWDEKAMRDLRARLDELRRDEPPFVDAPKGREVAGVHWVRPELVAEIEYLSWNGQGMLRHPSFQGLRFDKPAADVVPERPAAAQPSAPPADAPLRHNDAAAPPDASPQLEASPARWTHEAAAEQPPPADEPVRTRKMKKGERYEVVGGVAITNPGRVMFPDIGLTKVELARYYESVAELMLPHVARRPLTVVRCPEGHTNECFFQKHATESFPETVLRVPLREEGELVEYLAIDSLAGLLTLVQMGVLEFHVWGSHIETPELPDQLCIDLDPDPELPFARLAEGARVLRGLLEGLGLRSFVKTTGGKGLHVVAPIAPTRPWDELKAFAKALAEAIVAADPEHYVSTMAIKKRAGKIFIDYLRNGRGATYVTAFSTRRRPGAPVSTPLRWDELSPKLRADQYTVGNVRRRLAGLKDDPWHGFHEVRPAISGDMLRAVGLRREKSA